MLSKRTTSNGNYDKLPPVLLEYIPNALREEIGEAFEREGIMNEPAEQRILRAIAENHKEMQLSIAGLKETLHVHDKRLTLEETKTAALKGVVDDIAVDMVELKKAADDVADLKDAAKTADNERRDTKRLVKASLIGIAITLAVTGVMGYYGWKTPAPQPAATVETKQAVSDIKDLIQEIRQDREERKAEREAVPVVVPRPKRGTAMPRGRSQMIPDGAMRAMKEWPIYSSMQPPAYPEMRRPD